MTSDEIKSFTDLNTWKEGHVLVLKIYKITKQFPKTEQFALTSQIERAAVSITSNIAEGFSRYYFKDKVGFYYMARGSVSEVQNQLLIAKDLNYIEVEQFNQIFDQSKKTQALINGLINSILKQNI